MNVEICIINHWAFAHSFTPTIDETGINDERAADVEHECEDNKGEIHEL